MQQLQKITNHPVHIIDDNGELSPSAFIPFCQFGKNMSVMNVQLDLFSMPVCTHFKAKIFYDQLCYEVDVNRFQDKFTEQDLKLGLSMLVDTNFNRRYSFKGKHGKWLTEETLGIHSVDKDFYNTNKVVLLIQLRNSSTFQIRRK